MMKKAVLLVCCALGLALFVPLGVFAFFYGRMALNNFLFPSNLDLPQVFASLDCATANATPFPERAKIVALCNPTLREDVLRLTAQAPASLRWRIDVTERQEPHRWNVRLSTRNVLPSARCESEIDNDGRFVQGDCSYNK